MSYQLVFAPRALDDLEKIKTSGNKATINKLHRILQELMEHPYEGIGKPERLRHRENTYSRRLTAKDRVVYTINDNIINVGLLQLLGHYDDK